MANSQQNSDFPRVIKRLELIKTLISLEEDNEIKGHINKLREFSGKGELNDIITLLDEKSYSKAILVIEIFINQHNRLTLFIDPELQGLKLEAKSLEAELNKLSNEKVDLEKLIYEFGVRHNQEFGELIKKILLHRKQKAKDTPQQEETEKEYKEYSEQFEIDKEERIIELTDEEIKLLKQKYRRASKLCHPDAVSEDQKELADKMFSELNAAYERNDLNRVSEILVNLEKGNLFVNKSEAINEKQLLKFEIEKIRSRINELKRELQDITGSETYRTIKEIKDWDEYFSQAKEKLLLQLNDLEDAGK